MGKTHESSYSHYPNICSDIEVYRFEETLQIGARTRGLKVLVKARKEVIHLH